MTIRSALIAGAALAVLAATPALAQTNGWYTGLAGGANWLADSDVRGGTVSSVDHDMGYAVLGNVGYGWGDFRVEGELGYRDNAGDGTNSVDANTWSLMGNAIYDIATGTKLTPYIGFGVGLANVGLDGRAGAATVDSSEWVPAIQGILGLSYALTDNWALNADYRYLTGARAVLNTSNANTTVRGENENHTLLFGITYKFGAPPPAPKPQPVAAPAPAPRPAPPPAVAAPPAPPPAPRLPETYVVFFAFDKSDISPVAAQVLDRAIADFRATGMTRIVVEGHADRSGKDAYNQKLSERRSASVASYLTQRGVATNAIQTAGFGESRPRVPTPDGARNDENRRAEIFLRK